MEESEVATTVKSATRAGLMAVTVTVELPVTASLAAVITALPVMMPVTSPEALTAATAGALLDHVTTRPVSVSPAESRVVAESWTFWPAFTLPGAGVTTTDPIGDTASAWVEPLATFDSAPNVASTSRVPRKATSRNWYAVDRFNPATVHVRLAPIAVPATGVTQLP